MRALVSEMRMKKKKKAIKKSAEGGEAQRSRRQELLSTSSGSVSGSTRLCPAGARSNDKLTATLCLPPSCLAVSVRHAHIVRAHTTGPAAMPRFCLNSGPE